MDLTDLALSRFADSDNGIAYNGSDPLVRPAAHVPWVLMESGDIGSGGADRASVLNGHCSECGATGIVISSLPLLTLLNSTGLDVI